MKWHGPQAARYAAAGETLLRGELPVGWRWVQSSVSAQVAVHAPAGQAQAFAKIFLPRSWAEELKALLRGSRARRARQQADWLCQQGFSAPASLAWGRCGRREVVISSALEGVGFGDCIASFCPVGCDRKARQHKRALLQTVGTLLGQLHRLGLVHGDLRPNNLLVRWRDEAFELGLIDNERNRRYHEIPDALIRKNLVQLNMLLPNHLSRTDRLRLWRAYQQIYSRYQGDQARALLQAVQRRTRERLQGKQEATLVNAHLPSERCPW